MTVTIVGCRNSPCHKVCAKKIRNPLYSNYISIRNEPKHIEPHRISFAVHNGYLPPKLTKNVISHACHGNSYQKKKRSLCCITPEHLNEEPIFLNCSRNTCYRALKKKASKWRVARNKTSSTQKIEIATCQHTPYCFMNVGNWTI